MSPIRTRVWDGTEWRPLGGLDQPADPDRTLLTRGTYQPSVTTTGPLPSVTSFTQIEANSSGSISLVQANTTYENCEFWGEVSFKAPGIKVINSIFRGPAPGLAIKPLIKNYGTGYYHGIVENSLFDPYAWYTKRGYPMMTGATYINRPGIHGGDIELRWCHIRNVEDGVGFVQGDDLTSDSGNTGFNNGAGWVVPALQRFTVVDRCFIESGTHVAGPDYQAQSFAQSGGYPHCDAFQFNIGRNVWITGTQLGGPRIMTDYQKWPVNPSVPATSKDYSNAGLMIQQESGITDPNNPRWVTNVLIEDSFVSGGSSSINMNYKSGNTLSGVTIRRVKIAQRGANWGEIMYDGALISQGGGDGSYVAKGVDPAALQVNWSDVTVLETGASIPFTNN